LHVYPKVRKSPETCQQAITKTICNQICKYGRKPYLHIVILFASDPNVIHYAEDVIEQFLDNGIDVAIQKYLQETIKLASMSTRKDVIKAENLAEIICSSHADFLVVIGDRNMKNRSCQAKRKGKLIEMPITDVISLIWKSWPQNPHKTLARIQNLTPIQLELLLFQYCGLKHTNARIQYLWSWVDELKKLRESSESEEHILQAINNLQLSSIRLHKQFKKCIDVLDELQIHLEESDLERGCVVSLEYKPNSSHYTRGLISRNLQIFMKQALVDMMNEIETNSELLQEYDISIWKEYLVEHRATWKIDLEALKITPLAEGSKYTRRGLQQMKDVDILLDSDSDEGFFANSDTESIDENLVTKARSKSVENIKPPMTVSRVRSHSSCLSGSRTWEYDPMLSTTYKLSDLSISPDNPLNSPYTGLSQEDSSIAVMDIGHTNMTAPIPLSSLHYSRVKSGGSINTTNSNLFGVSLTNDYRTKEQLTQFSDRSHTLSHLSMFEKDFSPIVGSPPKTSINRQEFSPFSCTPFPTTQPCLFTNPTPLKMPENSLDQYMKISHIWDTQENQSMKVNYGLK